MMTTQLNEQCEQALRSMDSLIPGATPSLPLTQHLAACDACSREFEVRKQVVGRLRAAVKGSVPPAYFEARIRRELKSTSKPLLSRGRFAAAAACILACVGAYQLIQLRVSINSQESYIASVSNQVASIMRVGLRDHLHCAVFRKYPKNPPRLDEVAKKLGAHDGLLQIASKHVPSSYRPVMGHECSYHGRPFIHLALKSDSRVLSLVLARKEDGESFETERLAPALSAAGVALYSARAHSFQIASFESRDYLVYLISDLPGKENMMMLAALAPELRDHLKKIEI